MAHGQDHRQADHRVGGQQDHLVPPGGPQLTQDEEVDLSDRFGLALLDEGLDGGEEAGHRHPGQHQAGYRIKTTTSRAH